jgi:hypothetical protein
VLVDAWFDDRCVCLSAGVDARLSIIPGVKHRFDLTEVVEASGEAASTPRGGCGQRLFALGLCSKTPEAAGYLCFTSQSP